MYRFVGSAYFMSRTIWKFPIKIQEEQTITVPGNPTFLHAGLDPSGQACVWAMVYPGDEKREHKILLRGTGHPIEVPFGLHLGTFLQGEFVWHVFI